VWGGGGDIPKEKSRKGHKNLQNLITASMIKQHTSQNAIYQKSAPRGKIKFNFGESLGEKNIEGMTVCPRHRHAFGISFSGLQQRASIPNMQEKQKHT
jgi:hypothetical protein